MPESSTQPAQVVNGARPDTFERERRLLTVVPALNVTLTPRTGIVLMRAGKTDSLKVTVNVTNNLPKAAGKVRLKVPEGWTVTPNEHIFDFDREIYGENLTVEFIQKIRNEQKFNGLEELKAQIARDKETCKGLI